MLIYSAIDPDVFSDAVFADALSRKNLESYFRGLFKNGLAFVDSNGCMLQEYSARLKRATSFSGSERVTKLFEEIVKLERQKRFLFVRLREPAQKLGFSTVVAIGKEGKADFILSTRNAHLDEKSGDSSCRLIPLCDYVSSAIEETRDSFTESIQMDLKSPEEIASLLSPTFRFSRILRIYDPKIGDSNRPKPFFDGINFILESWVNSNYFSTKELDLCIYTKVRECDVHRRGEEFLREIEKFVVNFSKFSIKSAKIYFKLDPRCIFHSRWLETHSALIHFERGFDLFCHRGKFRRNFMRIDNRGANHLEEIRNLNDYTFKKQ
jgi:hypothetical protein